MGQYYKIIILADNKINDKEFIRLWFCPSNYGVGIRLMEHAFIGNPAVEALEYLISPEGMFYKSRIVWAGDYAYNDVNVPNNLYNLCVENGTNYYQPSHDTSKYRYIVNHTKKLYFDKNYIKEYYIKNNLKYMPIHPLPLLVSEGNGSGNGDYYSNNYELCGTWSRDVISVEETIPNNYSLFNCIFYED